MDRAERSRAGREKAAATRRLTSGRCLRGLAPSEREDARGWDEAMHGAVSLVFMECAAKAASASTSEESVCSGARRSEDGGEGGGEGGGG